MLSFEDLAAQAQYNKYNGPKITDGIGMGMKNRKIDIPGLNSIKLKRIVQIAPEAPKLK